MQTQYEKLTDPQWQIMKEYLPVQRRRKYDLRTILDAIFWYLRVGSQWRNLPDSFPKWQLVYYRAPGAIFVDGNRTAPWKDSMQA
jgi:putative transposase